ncbi:MAG: DNA gyrase inhibitor YacG [Alphaproteobacteria bacterium]|nr:DNA gyrase inhibitor YacG [Alphaproteobacteria bacterium]
MFCVICKKQCQDQKFAPFCSLRCKNLDLGKWFNGSYFIPESNNEKNARQISDLELYNESGCPDSSVGRAED